MRSIITGAVLLLVGGCGQEPDSYVTLQLPQVTCPDDLALSSAETCRFSVQIHEGPWHDAAPPTIFNGAAPGDDGYCVPYGGDLITITGITVGDDMTVHVKAYSDSECTKQVLEGARGGVRVRDGNDQDDGIWFVPTFRTGAFSAFPAFSQGVRDVAAATSCESDADCRQLGTDGFTYEVSPIASCDTDAGVCEIPRTAFPLNMAVGRALHTATTLSDGRIAFVGGVGINPQEKAWLGTDEVVEVFDPVRMTFGQPTNDLPGDLRVGGHAAVHAGGNTVAFFGGARQMNLELVPVSPDAGARQYLRAELPLSDVTQTDNVSDIAFTVNLDDGSVTTSTLSSPRALLDASRVTGGVLVTGGGEPVGQGAIASTSIDMCTLDGGVECEPLTTLEAPRIGHCSVCLQDEADGECARLMLFGGIPREQEGLADDHLSEIFASGSLSSVGVLQSDIELNVATPTCVRGGGNNYLVGGSERSNRPPGLAPGLLSTTNGDAKVGVNELANTGGVVSPFRVHSAAVALGNGRVLVTGGLDDNGKAVASAYLIDGNEIVDQFNMVAARFGHTATRITTGPMRGAVIVAGGFTVNDDGDLEVVDGAELYVP